MFLRSKHTDAATLTAPAFVAPATVEDGQTCLNCLPHGVGARVVGVKGSGAVSRRLMEMGVVPGAPVRVIKAAPLGDPLEIRVHTYHLALRRNEAQAITVIANDE
jgi:Fe2+ transport system protein FeoA